MSSQYYNQYDFSFDLTFQAASVDYLDCKVDHVVKERLMNSRIWEKDLLTWINSLRTNKALRCPVLVREAQCLSMGLHLTNDSTISGLNKTWRDKDESTDVLSFPILDDLIVAPPHECVELGDVFVSVTTAETQARQMNHDLTMELRWLVSHGVLHLLGWDHSDNQRLHEMLNCQNWLLSLKDSCSVL